MSAEVTDSKDNLLGRVDAIAGSPEVIKTISLEAGKLVGVNLYPDSAEVSRSYRFAVQNGWNMVHISNLPQTMDAESLRVDVKGSASIRNVVVKRTRKPPLVSSDAASLQSQKRSVEKQLERVKKTMDSLDTYSGTLNVENVQPDHVGGMLRVIRDAGTELDEESLKLEKQLERISQELEVELDGLTVAHSEPPFGASITLFSDQEREIEAQVTYVVSNSSWSPSYDIRVDTQAINSPVTLIYKAIIKRSSGECWNNVSLTLRTLSPSSCVNVPSLDTWPVSLHIPVASPQPLNRKRRRESTGGTPARKSGTYGKRNAAYEDGSDDEEEVGDGEDVEVAEYVQEDANVDPAVEEDGGITLASQPSATFKLPGEVSISSGDGVHSIVIAELKSAAKLTWVCAPGGEHGDTRAHLKAQIRNASEYTLLPSAVNVYADGCLVSRTMIPTVNPTETFECPLYVDPTVRVTYHSPVKNVTTTGFYNKSRSHSTTTRITVHNTKSIPIHNFKVLDRIPISEDTRVAVKLTSPALKPPIPGADRPSPAVMVGAGVFAQWYGADEADANVRMLGKDGRFFWLCDIPAQGTVNLVSQWEVLAPLDAQDGRVKVPDADGGAEVWVTEASHIISSFIPKMPNKESCLDPIWQSDGLGESNQEIVKSLKNIIARSVDASSRLRIFPEH
uniref:Mucoidy inhibitor a n=1 Tax=Moniliophthora roreri TaxID=221103 RepID=A0A0W0G8Q6_MONRR